MDFSVIKEIGSAFLVGATALLIAEAYLYFCCNWTITGFFRLPIGIDSAAPGAKESGAGVQLGAFVGIATILGILSQSTFQWIVDNADYPIRAVPTHISALVCGSKNGSVGCLPAIPSKSNLRLHVFYDWNATAQHNEPTNLTRVVLSQDLPRRYCMNSGLDTTPMALVADVLQPADNPTKDCLMQLYYLAKNWAFTQPTLFDELNRIQARIDFARSFSLVLIFLLPWGIAFSFSSFAARLLGLSGVWQEPKKDPNTLTSQDWQKRLLTRLGPPDQPTTQERYKWAVLLISLGLVASGAVFTCVFDRFVLREDASSKLLSIAFATVAALIALACVYLAKRDWTKEWPTLHRSIWSMVFLCLTLFTLHVVGFYAYAWEEQEFSKRAFGYFATHDLLERKLTHLLPDSVHWFRDSAEQKASYLQTYRAATNAARAASKGREPKSWGVVLDIDETILDNSDYQKLLAMNGEKHDTARFNSWTHRQEATVLPGAKEFIDAVRDELHGKVILVTNRGMAQCTDTEANLHKDMITYDQILCDRDGNEDKKSRFESITRGIPGKTPALDVLVWVGDNIRDFPNLDQKNADDSGAFGVRYFVLPNPMYGSWQAVPYR